jgi:uncharacterized SAM-binding protein YcdF (DUF218 family)
VEALLDAIVEFIKANLVPGSFSFLLIGATFGIPALFLDERWRRRSRTWLTGLVLMYWILSLPACSAAIEASLDRGYAPLTPAEAEDFDLHTIVILGGGIESYYENGRVISTLSESTASRVLEGARLYALLDDPWVIASGGGGGQSPLQSDRVPESRAMRQALVALGVPDGRILEESASTDTRQEAVNIRAGFAEQVGGKFALVTSATHMRRALVTFQAVGLQPVPSPAQDHAGASATGFQGVLPSLDSLSASSFVLREYMALVYYGLRGWTSVP